MSGSDWVLAYFGVVMLVCAYVARDISKRVARVVIYFQGSKEKGEG